MVPVASADTYARDEHRRATILVLLVFLWGAVSLVVDPWEPFWRPNVAQVIGCGALLVYFLVTRNRPRRLVAEVVSLVLVAYAVLLLPWIAVVWCRLGRPLDAYFIPHVAAISMALVFPGRQWLAVTAMCLFAADGFFVSVYAWHHGLAAAIPITEPMATLLFATFGIGLVLLRRRRRDLAQRHVRAQSEIEALDRARPLLARTCDALAAQISIVATEIRATPAMACDAPPGAIGRALDRLGDLRGRLGGLVTGERVTASRPDAERQLIARDSQVGALLFAALGVILAVPTILTLYVRLGFTPIPMFVALFVIYCAVLTYLVITRHRPSSTRAVWAAVVLYAATLPVIAYNQHLMLMAGRPFGPFLGFKMLMVMIALTLAARFKLGVALIVVTAICVIGLWYALDLGAHSDIIPLGEPWTSLIYMLISLASLRMLEQRQVASVQLLRAEAEASALQRRARVFMALHDRLNSPLQTLVLGASGATAALPESSRERAQAAIERLVDLSRELVELDLLVLPQSTSLDPDRELRRRI